MYRELKSRKCPEIVFVTVLILAVWMRQTTGLAGYQVPCTNEGDVFDISFPCFKCFCQNGYVECNPESCPSIDDCFFYKKKGPGQCCDKCKGCLFEGRHIDSSAEWTDPSDPCISYKCVSGIITRSDIKCYTPCSDPIPPQPGECCPSCSGCRLHGQQVFGETVLGDDPCVKCTCAGDQVVCTKRTCPVLQCLLSKQVRTKGECCPTCAERFEEIHEAPICIIGKNVYHPGHSYVGDKCSSCTCQNGTSVCVKNTCPILECGLEDQRQEPGECCTTCLMPQTLESSCATGGKVYSDHETWNLDTCTSCECWAGEIRCAKVKCSTKKCNPNEILMTLPGECCTRCVENPSVCTVFGDPHYKTFDGKFYNFQGSCKYQLTADCVGRTFSIRITNNPRLTQHSSWTKTVTLKLLGVNVTLGTRKRIKVNGIRVQPPYLLNQNLHIYRSGDSTEVIVETDLGVKLFWDEHNFIQVQVPPTYKGKLCGLCGNYNGILRDDMTTRTGLNMSQSVRRFTRSWVVGGPKACQRQNERIKRNQLCKTKRFHSICKPLQMDKVFGTCNSLLNPNNYFKSCKLDMCECPNRRCYCDSMAAYAHECIRHNVSLPDWRTLTKCGQGKRILYRKNEISRKPSTIAANHQTNYKIRQHSMATQTQILASHHEERMLRQRKYYPNEELSKQRSGTALQPARGTIGRKIPLQR